MRHDLSRQSDTGAEGLDIVLFGHVIEQDGRLGCRIGGIDADVPPAFRFVRPDMDLKAVPVESGIAVVAHRGGQEMILNVRPLQAGLRPDESAAFEVIGRTQARFEEEPACADQELAERVQLTVQRDRLGAAELEIDFQVVLKIAADAGQIVHHIDTGRLQHLGRTDTGQLQQLRRSDRSGGQDDLPRRLHVDDLAARLIPDTDRLLTVQQHFMGQRAGDDRQVWPVAGGFQIGVRGRPAHAVLDGHMHPPEAFLAVAVIVFGETVPRLFPGLDPGLVKRVPHFVAVTGTQRSVTAAIGVGVAAVGILPGFGPAEVGQTVAIGPTGRAMLLPFVEIAGMTAHIDHAVDRRGPAQHLAARRVQAAIVQARLRQAFKEPVELLHVHRDRKRRRHLNEDGGIAAARLDQKDLGLRVFGQARRQDASRRPRADNDVIESLFAAHHAPSPFSRGNTGTSPFGIS